MTELCVKRLVQDATLPTRGSSGAVGYDLYSIDEVVVSPSQRALVGTGVAVILPMNVYGRVAPRSGLAVKHGIQVGAGVVDPDYRGEIKVVIFNQGDRDFEIKKGDRIAQLVLERCETPDVREVESLDDTDRGSGGFGSTGA
jgi:dUTP pyrophosphatase